MPNRIVDVSGVRHGRLIPHTYLGGSYWNCACDCGNEVRVKVCYLRRGKTKSCGCLKVESIRDRTTHGKSKDETRSSTGYSTWTSIKARCFNPKNTFYHNYGGRGITMCFQWRKSFEAFISYVGEKPSPKHSIDRINNDGNYEPGNVRWVTSKENCSNTRANRWIELDGNRLTVTQWNERLGYPNGTIKRRLHLGWPEYKAVTTPPRKLQRKLVQP